MRRALIATAGVIALLGAAVQPASAADVPVKAPIVKTAPAAAPIYNWSGLYVGGHVGYSWGDADWFFPVATYISNAGDAFSHDLSGWLAGGHIGFNHQVGAWVWGIEGTFSWADIEDVVLAPLGFTGDDARTRLEWQATATGRAGYAWNLMLLYVKGGYAAGRVRADICSVASCPDFGLGSGQGAARTHHGWTIGVGGEYALARNWIVGIEYNYIDLGTERYTDIVRPPAGPLPLM